MNIQDLESKKLPDLREIAKAAGIKKVESFKKAELIQAIAGQDNAPTEKIEKVAKAEKVDKAPKPVKEAKKAVVAEESVAIAPTESTENSDAPVKRRRRIGVEKVIIGVRPDAVSETTTDKEEIKTDLFSENTPTEVKSESATEDKTEDKSENKPKGRDIRQGITPRNPNQLNADGTEKKPFLKTEV